MTDQFDYLNRRLAQPAATSGVHSQAPNVQRLPCDYPASVFAIIPFDLGQALGCLLVLVYLLESAGGLIQSEQIDELVLKERKPYEDRLWKISLGLIPRANAHLDFPSFI